jgi:hypothetical protein
MCAVSPEGHQRYIPSFINKLNDSLTENLGGVIPELDSHVVSPANSEPIGSRFSPWHACGPTSTYERYASGMRRHADLHLIGVVLRLQAGDEDTQGAARKWEDMFGVKCSGDRLIFENAELQFTKGVEGEAEGICEIIIGIDSQIKVESILARARTEGLDVVERAGCLDMLGVKWTFVEHLGRGTMKSTL